MASLYINRKDVVRPAFNSTDRHYVQPVDISLVGHSAADIIEAYTVPVGHKVLMVDTDMVEVSDVVGSQFTIGDTTAAAGWQAATSATAAVGTKSGTISTDALFAGGIGKRYNVANVAANGTTVASTAGSTINVTLSTAATIPTTGIIRLFITCIDLTKR